MFTTVSHAIVIVYIYQLYLAICYPALIVHELGIEKEYQF